MRGSASLQAKPGAKRRQAHEGARREDYAAGVGGLDVAKPTALTVCTGTLP